MTAKDTNADLAVQLETLAKELRELDARNLELEQLAAQRGVKLSCANIALSRAKIAFEQAANRREEMVQDVAHDLRTPLTSIKGATQNLLDEMAGPLSDSAREYVEIVGDQAERLIGIVNWLVDAIRVSLDPVELKTAPVEIDQLAKRVVRGLRPIADEQQIDLAVETKPAGALVDPDKLLLVLENLVGNALKFTESGGEVSVSVRPVEQTVEITVADTGSGLSPDEAEHVFDRYYRSSHPRGGSGLGLSISRELVRLHGGDVAVTSEKGKGSTFVVTLPSDCQASSEIVRGARQSSAVYRASACSTSDCRSSGLSRSGGSRIETTLSR
jgi:signal transduction histidine kinase